MSKRLPEGYSPKKPKVPKEPRNRKQDIAPFGDRHGQVEPEPFTDKRDENGEDIRNRGPGFPLPTSPIQEPVQNEMKPSGIAGILEKAKVLGSELKQFLIDYKEELRKSFKN